MPLVIIAMQSILPKDVTYICQPKRQTTGLKEKRHREELFSANCLLLYYLEFQRAIGLIPITVRLIKIFTVKIFELFEMIRTQRLAHFVFFPKPATQIDEFAAARTKRSNRFLAEARGVSADRTLRFHKRPTINRHCAIGNCPPLRIPFKLFMNRRLLISLLLLGFLAFSGCSDQARYNRYVRSSVRAKEKRQKQWRKEMENQKREQIEALQDVEPAPVTVTVQ
jgi:hypothetical protein